MTIQEALLEKTQEAAADLLNNNSEVAASELIQSAKGKLTISLSLKCSVVKNVLHVDGSFSYTRKHSDDTQCSAEIDDPKQVKLL